MAENTTEYKVIVDTEVKGQDQLEGAGDAAETAGGKFTRLQTQIRETQRALQQAAEQGDTVKFNKLKGDLDDLQDKLELTQKRSLEFKDALAEAPGPIGAVGKGLQGLDGTFKAFLANPIVLTLAAIVGAFVSLKEALSRTEEGTAKLNKISEGFTKILNGLFAILEPVANMFADLIIGLMENKTVMDGLAKTAGVLSAAFSVVFNVGKQLVGFIINNMVNAFKTLVEVAGGAGKVLKGVFTFDLDLIKEGVSQVGDGIKKGFNATVENVKNTAKGIGEGVVNGIKDGYAQGEKAFKEGQARLTEAEKKAQEERNKKAQEAAKKRAEEEKKLAEQRNKDIQAAQKVEVEAYLASLDARDKEIYKRGEKLNEDLVALEKARNAKIAEELKKAGKAYSEVDVAKAIKDNAPAAIKAQEEFNASRIAVQQAYNSEVANINKKFDDEEAKKAEEKKQKEKEIAKLAFEEATLANENRTQALEQRYNREIAIINDKEKLLLATEGISEEKKKEIREQAAVARLAAQINRADELIAIVDEKEKLALSNVELNEAQRTKIVLDAEAERAAIRQAKREDEILSLDNELNTLGTTFDRRRELIAQKEQELLQQEGLTENQRTAIRLQAAEERRAIDEAELNARADLQNAYLDLAGQFGSVLQQIAGKNKKIAKAGVIIEQAAAIAKIIVNTGIANAKAVAALPITAGQPFVTINTISAGLSIASAIAAASKAIKQIDASDSGKAETGGSNIPKPAPPAAPQIAAGGGVAVPQITGTQGAATPGAQIAQTIGAATNKPIRAYVVSGDITSQQALDRRTTRAATFSGGTNG